MTHPAPTATETIRAEAAAAERAEILEIIERSARHLSHGHGASGAQVIELILAEVRRRDDA